jgi:hypothetical protein
MKTHISRHIVDRIPATQPTNGGSPFMIALPSFLHQGSEDREERPIKMVRIDIIITTPGHALLPVPSSQKRLLDFFTNSKTSSKTLATKVSDLKSSCAVLRPNFDLRRKDGVVYIELKFQVLLKGTDCFTCLLRKS